MNWRHIQLIYHREMRDQLRDRRTLFTIAVLPMLLYPLIGLLMMQVAQFNREYSVRIRIVGQENWPQNLPLIDHQRHLASLPGAEVFGRLIEFTTEPWPTDAEELSKLRNSSSTAVQLDLVDAVLIVKPDFARHMQERLAAKETADPENNSSNDQAQITASELTMALSL